MVELLGQMSVTQLVVYTFMLLTATQGVWRLWDFFADKFKQKTQNIIDEQSAEKKILDEIEVFKDYIQKHDKETQAIQSQFLEIKNSIENRLDKQEAQLNLLTESDKDDIRSWIVDKYHYFYEQKGSIDDFSMDAIEKRYAHYSAEGGNSYITSLVEKLRELPPL